MNVEIVSPERVLYEGTAQRVVCRTTNGDIAFLSGHEPFLGVLASGEIRVVLSDSEEFAFNATRGFVEVDGTHVRVISDDAVPA